MFIILFFTVVGFFLGLSFVMAKRKIRPGKILAATFLGFLSSAIWKVLRDYYKTKSRRRYF